MSFLFEIKSMIFDSKNKHKNGSPVTPIFDIPDLESGGIIDYKMLMSCQQSLEPDSRIYYDLEKGDKSVIIEKYVFIDTRHKGEIIENCEDDYCYFDLKYTEDVEDGVPNDLLDYNDQYNSYIKIPLEYVDVNDDTGK